MTHTHQDDGFEIQFEAQQMRAENFHEPFRGTISNVDEYHFEFGKRTRIFFHETPDFYLPSDPRLSDIARAVGSRMSNTWIGVELQLTPTRFKNKQGEEKFTFVPRVIKGPIPPAEAPAADDASALVEFDDEVPF